MGVPVVQGCANAHPILQEGGDLPALLRVWDRSQLWKIPLPNPHFSGRQEELLSLREKFEKEPLVILTGSVGVGKTQLAKRYTYQFLPQYDLVGWFYADETLPVQMQKFVQALNRCLKKPGKIPTQLSFESLLEALSNFLKQNKVKCLLIFDNANDLELLKPYSLLAQGTAVHMLVTSRSQITSHATLNLSPFSRKDSLDFLRKTLPQVSEAEQKKLAQALADHPLVLSLAAGYFHLMPGVNVHNYLAFKKRSIETSLIKFAEAYAQDLNAAVCLTLRSLKEKFPEAFELVEFFAHLHPTQIPFFLAEQFLEVNSSVAQDALRVLCDSALVDVQQAQSSQNPDKTAMLVLHPLVHQIIGAQLSLQERQRFLERALPLIATSFAGQSAGISTRILRRPEFFLHAKKLSTLAEELAHHSLALLSLRIRMLNYLHAGLRDFEQARKFVGLIEADQDVFKAQDRVNRGMFSGFETFSLSLEDRVIYETERGFLAAAFEMDWRASVFHGMRALTLLKNSPENHAERLRVMSNILQSYTLTGSLQQANVFLEKAIPTLKACTNPLRRMVFAVSWAGLLTIEGHFEKALVLLAQHEPLLQSLRDHPPPGLSLLRAKAENLVRLGHTEECAKVLSQLLKGIRNFYGNREPPILATFFVLKAMNSLGQPEAALKNILLLKKALAIYAQAWSGKRKHLYQGFAYYALGCAYEKKGDFMAALTAYQEAESVYESVLYHKAIPDVSLLYGAVAKLAYRLKDGFLARAYLRKHSQTFGLEHPRTAELMKCIDRN